jgi:hypothetical protein
MLLRENVILSLSDMSPLLARHCSKSGPRRRISQSETSTVAAVGSAKGQDQHPACETRKPKCRLLFVKQRLPVDGHRPSRSGGRLIQRVTDGSGKLRAGESFFSAIVIKPVLARFEALDYRVARRCGMFRCMLTWRTVAAANVTALRASAKMEPPSARGEAFDTSRSARLDRRVDAIPFGLHGFLFSRM